MVRSQVETVTVQMRCTRFDAGNYSHLGRTLAFRVLTEDGGGFCPSDELVGQRLVPELLKSRKRLGYELMLKAQNSVITYHSHLPHR